MHEGIDPFDLILVRIGDEEHLVLVHLRIAYLGRKEHRILLIEENLQRDNAVAAIGHNSESGLPLYDDKLIDVVKLDNHQPILARVRTILLGLTDPLIELFPILFQDRIEGRWGFIVFALDVVTEAHGRHEIAETGILGAMGFNATLVAFSEETTRINVASKRGG